MKLKLTLEESGGPGRDLLVDAEPHVLVETVAAWIMVRRSGDPAAPSSGKTLSVVRNDRYEVLRSSATLAEAGLRSGDVVSLSDASAYAAAPMEHAATVRVTAGPDAGAVINIASGSCNIGRERDCQIRLRDPLVSKHHARINVTDVVEVVDTNSSNGVLVAGVRVGGAVVGANDEIVVGDTTLLVQRVGAVGLATGTVAGAIAFNRSPRLDPLYPGVELKAPEPPAKQPPQRLPIAMLVMPILMGGVLYLITKNIASVAFVAMSPLMMLGSYLEQRKGGDRAFAEATRLFRESTADLVVRLQRAFEQERAARCHEHPSTEEVVSAALAGQQLLWTRRDDRHSYLDLRLGLGTQPSRSSIELPMSRNTTAELWEELIGVTERFAFVDRVPVVAPFSECKAVGVCGPAPALADTARGLIVQLAGLHSPAEVVIGAVLSSGSLADWSWMKWLPHASSEHSPLPVEHLTSTGPAAAQLVAAVEELIEGRAAERSGPDTHFEHSMVLLIDEDAPIERPRLVELAERGPAVGVYTVWLGADLGRLPAVCSKFVVVDRNTMQTGAGSIAEGGFVAPIEVGLISAADAQRFARTMSPLIDAGALLDESGDLPSTVSFVSEQGPELIDDPSAVIERWRGSQSVSSLETAPPKRDRTLHGFVGVSAAGPLSLDLRTHGPHALVGGTTGSGKSEFLQTWLLGMAVSNSPERVNFLLVDYKGGSAFGKCEELPHSVGMVTDLTQRLVRRVLVSLRAELTRREHVLQEWSAKDLMDLEGKERSGAPIVPSLVIVVDEFAALIQEIPEFVDGMIDIAQRGRSLGLHLILATQRPSGVIKGNLRANTNLRVALRMADDDDSSDVVGSLAAARFDPSTPGRAVAKMGPGKLQPFQAAYVGGWTTGEAPPAKLRVFDLPFGTGAEWEAPVEAEQHARDVGKKDLERLVETITTAFETVEMDRPAQPWLPELASRYELSAMPTRRLDSELVFAVRDDPARQDQVELAFLPDRDGNLVAFGTGGSGKSTFLRSIAIAAGISVRGGPCAVYGLDFGARGLSMLEALPHVGSIIGGEDEERVSRLIRQLRDTIDERAVRYAAARADSIVDYRRLANAPNETRVILLVDGAGSFRSSYELGPRSRVFEAFQSIAMDGRPVGVHVVMATDRMSSVPASLLSVVPNRITLRLADEMDLVMQGVAADAFDTGTPPGRGYADGSEIQIGVLAIEDDASVAAQAEAIETLAASMVQQGVQQAPPIERLVDRIALADLPVEVGGRPTIGLADDTLGPIGLYPGDSFIVCGPPASGKSTTVLTLVESLRRWNGALTFVYLGNRRSPIGAQPGWSIAAMGEADVAEVARTLHAGFQDDSLDPTRHVIVIDGTGDFLNTEADEALQNLIKVGRTRGATVIAEGETATMMQSWMLFKEARASRHGLVLQPDQIDGDNLFNTSFGRLARAEFPEGRGMYVRSGKATRVQIAMPS